MTTLLKIYLQQFLLLTTICLAIKKKLQGLPKEKEKKKPTRFLETENQNQHGWEAGTKR